MDRRCGDRGFRGSLRQLSGDGFRLDKLRNLAWLIGRHKRGQLVCRDGDDGDLLSSFGAGRRQHSGQSLNDQLRGSSGRGICYRYWDSCG